MDSLINLITPFMETVCYSLTYTKKPSVNYPYSVDTSIKTEGFYEDKLVLKDNPRQAYFESVLINAFYKLEVSEIKSTLENYVNAINKENNTIRNRLDSAYKIKQILYNYLNDSGHPIRVLNYILSFNPAFLLTPIFEKTILRTENHNRKFKYEILENAIDDLIKSFEDERSKQNNSIKKEFKNSNLDFETENYEESINDIIEVNNQNCSENNSDLENESNNEVEETQIIKNKSLNKVKLETHDDFKLKTNYSFSQIYKLLIILEKVISKKDSRLLINYLFGLGKNYEVPFKKITLEKYDKYFMMYVFEELLNLNSTILTKDMKCELFISCFKEKLKSGKTKDISLISCKRYFSDKVLIEKSIKSNIKELKSLKPN